MKSFKQIRGSFEQIKDLFEQKKDLFEQIKDLFEQKKYRLDKKLSLKGKMNMLIDMNIFRFHTVHGDIDGSR